MFCENAVRQPYDVDGDERARSDSGEATVQEDEVSLGDDQAVLVVKFGGQGLDQFEKPFATRRDVSTVLDVFRRPISLGCLVVARLLNSVSNALITNAFRSAADFIIALLGNQRANGELCRCFCRRMCAI